MYGVSGFDYSLFDQLQRMQNEVEDLFNGGGWRDIRSLPRGSFPAVNIGTSAEKIDVYLFVPGIDAKALEISVQNQLLTISGRRELDERTDKDNEAAWYRRERFQGEFRRIVSLPEDADPERIEARYRDGVLHVAVQRRESAKPRQIKVH